ncbi:hypothetical protein [Paenibacillus sp. 481]|nr:hypothetical protein [Paenibacillus sp. 481]
MKKFLAKSPILFVAILLSASIIVGDSVVLFSGGAPWISGQ